MAFVHIFSANGLAAYHQTHPNVHADLLAYLQSHVSALISTIGFHDCEHDPLMVTIQYEAATDATPAQLANFVTNINARLAALGTGITIQLLS